MARTARLLLTVVILGGVLALPAARAQAPAAPTAAATPAPAASSPAASPVPATEPGFAEIVDGLQNMPAPLPSAAAAASESGWEPEFLKSLPRPPDQPRSLFQPAPTIGPPPRDLEHPYFQWDPILDPPQWQPGWFSDFQLGVVQPHVFANQMKQTLPFSGRKVTVAPGSADLPFTIAPRFEVGYRLPSGFGGFAFSDRFFNTSASGQFIGPSGAMTRSTNIGVNYSDWDYISREYTPWANWEMEWRVGVRLAETWIRNRVDQPFAQAVATNGVFISGDQSYTVGAGPHIGLVLQRKLSDWGLTFVEKADLANTFTREHQQFSAALPILNPNGAPVHASYLQNFWQQVPILNLQAGFGWQPPSNPNIKVFVGYVYEMWWQVSSNSNIDLGRNGGSRMNFNNQGMVFQAGYKW